MKRKYRGSATDDEKEDASATDESSLVRVIQNRIYFYADISKETVLNLYEKINEAHESASKNESAHSPRTIYLYIHSDGGCAYSALSAFFHLRQHPCKIVTIADGFCASAATILFLGGHERWISKHACLLIHQLRTCFYGKFDDLRDEFKNSTTLMNTLREIYTTHTNISTVLLDKCLSSEEWITSAQCIEHGIAQKLLAI